ncbi:MAG: TolC family protein [Gemmataceae bacterium]|nr:TolC family protein [Gemmataceae bacterium]
MRWIITLLSFGLAFAGLIGCKQQCYVRECDLDHYRTIGLTPELECTPGTAIAPEAGNVRAPATVLDPDRPPRFISLAECIALALEQGSINNLRRSSILGIQAQNILNGFADDELVQFTGRGITGDQNIRVLAMDPAIQETDIEASLAKFDARWQTSVNWTNTDRPVGTALDTFQAARTNVRGIQLQDATFSTQLIKPLPTGGVSGITFRTDYELSNLNPRVNPAWRPALQFAFEQPLLQGFGVEINQLRSTHPGSLLTPFSVAGRVEGILLTRIRFDQARADFERNVNLMLINVEYAYWYLYGAYWELYSREQALRQAYEAWRINKARYEAGRIPIQDFAQSRGQYETFRDQRITSLGKVLENERALRVALGLPVEDGTRLVPSDEPTLTPYVPDWNTALNEAENLVPELVLARQELKARQLDLINQKNQLLPDLRFTSTYDINALGSRLDGNSALGAMHNLGQDKFNNWSLGLRLDVPIGFRDAHAAVRASRLQLARSYNVMRDQELKVQRFLGLTYRRMFELYQNIEARRAQREAYAEQLQARFREFLAGRGTLDFLLEAQRNWADALQNEYIAISQYNVSIAGFQYAKGTIQQYDNVTIAEGPLPGCAQVRAVEHARERNNALVLAQHAIPQQPLCCKQGGECDPLMKMLGMPKSPVGGANPTIPVLPEGSAPSLPSLYKDASPLPEIREPLPRPRPSGPQSSRPMPQMPDLGNDAMMLTGGSVPPLMGAPAAPGSLPPSVTGGNR